MNTALILACMNNPNQLRQVSYQELKTLVLHFPYAANLRQLIWEKSQVENNPEKEKNLQIASLYSLNRRHLAEKFALLSASETPPAGASRTTPPSTARPVGSSSSFEAHPKEKEFFSSWNESVGTPFTDLHHHEYREQLPVHRPVPVHLFKNTDEGSSVFAERGVQEHLMPVSETYAQLLVRQNQIAKAIEVYQRLILIFPEKSAFFAGEIENLKNI
jgi:hypothetical protein